MRVQVDLSNRDIYTLIGNGADGDVYALNIAVKEIKYIYSADEVNYNLKMSDKDIGPKIFDIQLAKNGRTIMYMEKFDTNLATITDPTLLKNVYYPKLAELTKQMALNRVACLDLKPANVVIKNNGEKVRLCDFCGNMCTPLTDTRLREIQAKRPGMSEEEALIYTYQYMILIWNVVGGVFMRDEIQKISKEDKPILEEVHLLTGVNRLPYSYTFEFNNIFSPVDGGVF